LYSISCFIKFHYTYSLHNCHWSNIIHKSKTASVAQVSANSRQHRWALPAVPAPELGLHRRAILLGTGEASSEAPASHPPRRRGWLSVRGLRGAAQPRERLGGHAQGRPVGVQGRRAG
jgi:hypothetical protein